MEHSEGYNLDEITKDIRVGVYVCHCGGNISDVVDVKAMADLTAEYPHVTVAKEYPFLCSDPGQALILEDIRANRINRVVVASCSPTLHESTFRRALQCGGLNPYLYEHVNIREQVSWVHKDNPVAATRKSLALIRAGVEKVIRQNPLKALRVRAERRVAVIGGGPAGMSAALALTRVGMPVELFEKEPVLGGRLLEIGSVFPTEEKAADLAQKLATDVLAQSSIQVHLNCEIKRVDGYVGNFDVHIVKDGQDVKVRVGALILATGFSHYRPFQGEYGFGTSPRVVTLPEFQRALNRLPEDKMLHWEGRAVKRLAFIHCVGSRQMEGVNAPQADGQVNDYCSRVCCTATLHVANQVLDRFPKTQIFDFYRDIRTYGRGHEIYYEQAARKGTLFFRYTNEAIPKYHMESDQAFVRVKDVLTWNEEVEVPVDLLVLSTGMMPQDIRGLVESLKLPIGADRFLQEAHPKLRPVEVANNGIFLAGTCQAPMTLDESCAAAGAAAVKASQLLVSSEINLDPFVVELQEDRCNGCGRCLEECSYTGSLTMISRSRSASGEKIVAVNPALCKGCGACAAVCETHALNVAGWRLDQFEAMVNTIAVS